MHRRVTVVAAGLAAMATFGSVAEAEDDCFGSMSFDDTYVCVVRVDPPQAWLEPGPQVLVPGICPGVIDCIPERFQETYEPAFYGGTVVLFHNGTCYYVTDFDIATREARSPEECP